MPPIDKGKKVILGVLALVFLIFLVDLIIATTNKSSDIAMTALGLSSTGLILTAVLIMKLIAGIFGKADYVLYSGLIILFVSTGFLMKELFNQSNLNDETLAKALMWSNFIGAFCAMAGLGYAYMHGPKPKKPEKKNRTFSVTFGDE